MFKFLFLLALGFNILVLGYLITGAVKAEPIVIIIVIGNVVAMAAFNPWNL